MKIYLICVQHPESPEAPWVADCVDEYTVDAGGPTPTELLTKVREDNKGSEVRLAAVTVSNGFLDKVFEVPETRAGSEHTNA